MGHSGGVVGISGSGRRVKVNEEQQLEVQSHTAQECFNADYADAQSAAAIITPASGKMLVVRQVYVSTEDIATNVTLEFATSGKAVFKLYTAKKQAQTGNVICGEGAVDEPLKLTCGAKTFISIAYDEL